MNPSLPGATAPGVPVREHHRRVIDRVAARFLEDDSVVALLVGGSVARGWARDDSDVDVIVVVTPDGFARREADGALALYDPGVADYPGGYADGKFVTLEFIEDVAARGSEPARAAFSGAFLAFSRDARVAGAARRAAAYPEGERDAKMRSFAAQVRAAAWFAGEAERRADRYLLVHAASELALFAGRLVLAHNRVLFPYHKWFMTAVRAAPDKPDGFVERVDALLAGPSRAAARAALECVEGFAGWAWALDASWPQRFLVDREWPWRRGAAPLEDA